MIVNLIVISLIIAFGFAFSRKEYRDSYKNRKNYIKVISFILILQSGLRNVAVGADTYNYYISFKESLTQSWQDVYDVFVDYYKYSIGKDPGFPFFQKICSSLSDSYQVFLFIIAIVFFVALGNFFLKNTNRLSDIVLGYVIYSVLFYSFFSITGHRQTIATAITLYSFEFLKKKKIVPFLIIIFVASTIHRSCLIFIPFYFICRIKKPKIIFIATLLLFPLFMLIRNVLALYFQSIGGYEEYNQFEGAGTITFSAMFILISIVALIRHRTLLKNYNNGDYYFNAFALALLFLPLTWINPNMMRVVQYFSIFMILFVPIIIHSFKSYSNDIYAKMKNFAILILILLFFKANLNAPPYGFFWQEMRLMDAYYTN